MKRYSTFLKLFMGNLLVMAVLIALGGLVAFHSLDANYKQESRQNQDRLVRLAARHFQELWPLDQPRIDRICKEMFQDPALRLTVIAADGTVLGDGSADPHTMANHRTASRPEVLAALSGQSDSDTRRSDTTGVQMRYVALPVRHADQVVAAVRLAVPVKAIAEGETFLRNALLWSALAGVVVAILLGLLISWIWYVPLRRVSITARQLASGNMEKKARLSGGGELGELARSLNEMRDRLREQIGRLDLQKQNLHVVLTSLQEGVVATDKAGRIVMMNKAAGQLLSVDSQQVIGSPIQSALPVLEVISCHDRATAYGKAVSSQFEANTPNGQLTIEVNAVPVASNDMDVACVLVVRDITSLAAASAMKAQFVANASHELRTPLATIRAAVDSLLETDPGDSGEIKKLSSVLDRHVARLESMTNDLLDLHMVESPRFVLRPQDILLSDLVDWIQSHYAAIVQEKNLHFEVTTDQPDYRLQSDRKLLELILRNLLNNAIKFTPSGGKVECRFKVQPQAVEIRVQDSGCGIAPHEQRRVFERFYQGDSARSGDIRVRGTGLGLAIVKHAAERLRAKVELQSELGKGTIVTVLLPISMTE